MRDLTDFTYSHYITTHPKPANPRESVDLKEPHIGLEDALTITQRKR